MNEPTLLTHGGVVEIRQEDENPTIVGSLKGVLTLRGRGYVKVLYAETLVLEGAYWRVDISGTCIQELSTKIVCDLHVENSFLPQVCARHARIKARNTTFGFVACNEIHGIDCTTDTVVADAATFVGGHISWLDSKATTLLANAYELYPLVRNVTQTNSHLSGFSLLEPPPLGVEFNLYKKVMTGSRFSGGHAIAVLRVPADARRAGLVKVRVERAQVVGFHSVTPPYQPLDLDVARSLTCSDFFYRKGGEVTSNFDPNRFNICSEGIHGFLLFQQALAYE